MYSKIVNAFLNRAGSSDLDPEFYRNYYKDLAELTSHKDLRTHYSKHGMKEGRFANQKALSAEVAKIKKSHEQFNVVAYKFYNPDLLKAYDRDDDFIVHYAFHGKSEGRKCTFDADGHGSGIDDTGSLPASPQAHNSTHMWEAIFSAPQAMAWFGDALQPVPLNKRAAMDAFRAIGVENLWPIELSFIFDPAFYRSIVGLPKAGELSGTELYLHWLEEGLPNGLAPNPQAYLYAQLGGAPFPDDFDWQNCALRISAKKNATKYDVFKKLFENTSFDVKDVKPFFEKNYAMTLLHVGKHALANGMYSKSVDVFSELIGGSPNSGAYCFLGDAYLRSGHAVDAIGAYKKSISWGDAPIWSFFNAIDLLIQKQEFVGVFDLITQAQKPWGHKIEFSYKLNECVTRYFDHESARAQRLLKEVNPNDKDCVLREAAERVLQLALDRIKNLYVACDNLPANNGGCPEGHVIFLANDDLRQCTHYRVEQKLLQFVAAGIPIKFFSHHDTENFLNSLAGARAAIFYRVPALPNILRTIIHAKAMGLPTYYEIDDLLFDSAVYPDPFESFEGQISPDEYCGLQFGVPLFRYAMAECDNIIASTPALARQMEICADKPSGIVVRNGLDSRNDIAIQLGSQPALRTDGRVRIFYGSGTKAHNADFNDLVGLALVAIMERYDHVELIIVGHLKLRPELQAFGDRLKTYPIISDLDAYWSLLVACDINLAVLHAGIVADCKSEIKWLEAAVLQIPSIVTATATYLDVIEPGVDGLLASDPADWLRHIETLVSDAGARRRIGAAAREKALNNYSVEQAASIWTAAFSPRGGAPVATLPITKRKLRVMVCNVFFHPQSIGGATRVVEENVRNLIDRYDDIEFAVFCSNEGDNNFGSMRIGHFQDVPVYRIATPMEEGMDWRPFNPTIKPIFEAALDAFKPDIIHFHCIQRLTASIVEVALARNIPYIVTLHDGWWISDNQFLVDEDGFLQLPTTDVIADCERSKRPLQSIERRQRLRALLQSADARLSVSAPFARVYTDAGIRDVDVVENGIPALMPLPRQPRADGRVALGHIGGRAAHKGAFLIEAALRQGNYNNLHLTMIDGTMATGETVETTWGATPVTLSGPYPQSRIAELYAKLDVLLAPSTWPESYGLVTREALSLGLWVVASNLGAIGQGVVEGENGHVIDTTTARDLKVVLTRINAEQEKYKSSQSHEIAKPRYMADQAFEIYGIYATVAGNIQTYNKG